MRKSWNLWSDWGFYIRERIEPNFCGSGSVRFDLSFQKTIRVRFGSIDFSQISSGSVRFDLIFEKVVRVRFGSSRVTVTLLTNCEQ